MTKTVYVQQTYANAVTVIRHWSDALDSMAEDIRSGRPVRVSWEKLGDIERRARDAWDRVHVSGSDAVSLAMHDAITACFSHGSALKDWAEHPDSEFHVDDVRDTGVEADTAWVKLRDLTRDDSRA